MKKEISRKQANTLMEYGITTTAFLMSDWMRTCGVPSSDIEDGLNKVSEYWTETISLTESEELKKQFNGLIRELETDAPIFEKNEPDNVVPIGSGNA